METLRSFEWPRNVAGYRLVWLPPRGKKAFWLEKPSEDWSEQSVIDRSTGLEYHGSKPIAERRGVYIAGHRQTINRRKPDDLGEFELVRPFESNELVSLNLLRTPYTPKGWLDFANRHGIVGHPSSADDCSFVGQGGGKDKRWHIFDAEHEGEWHRLRQVLAKIYSYYPAIEKRDAGHLSKFIHWESNDIVREDRGIKLGRTKVRMAIAMRNQHKAHYFDYMQRPDVFTPAAFVLRDDINRYLEKAISLQASFDPKTLEFSSSLKYGSLGAALVAEALEFMAGHFEARQCAVCGSWFRVGADQMRRDRLFCSAACKMRDYRTRKANRSESRPSQ